MKKSIDQKIKSYFFLVFQCPACPAAWINSSFSLSIKNFTILFILASKKIVVSITYRHKTKSFFIIFNLSSKQQHMINCYTFSFLSYRILNDLSKVWNIFVHNYRFQSQLVFLMNYLPAFFFYYEMCIKELTMSN